MLRHPVNWDGTSQSTMTSATSNCVLLSTHSKYAYSELGHCHRSQVLPFLPLPVFFPLTRNKIWNIRVKFSTCFTYLMFDLLTDLGSRWFYEVKPLSCGFDRKLGSIYSGCILCPSTTYVGLRLYLVLLFKLRRYSGWETSPPLCSWNVAKWSSTWRVPASVIKLRSTFPQKLIWQMKWNRGSWLL